MNTRQTYEYCYREYRRNKGNAAFSFSKASLAAWRTYHANFELLCEDPILTVNHMAYKGNGTAIRYDASKIALLYNFASDYRRVFQLPRNHITMLNPRLKTIQARLRHE